jgi:hypothetical protein
MFLFCFYIKTKIIQIKLKFFIFLVVFGIYLNKDICFSIFVKCSCCKTYLVCLAFLFVWLLPKQGRKLTHMQKTYPVLVFDWYFLLAFLYWLAWLLLL